MLGEPSRPPEEGPIARGIPSKALSWQGLGALLALALLAHGLALSTPFQFDDLHQIRDNPAMQDIASLPRFFVDPWLCSGNGTVYCYRPLLFASFVLDGIVGSGSPLPYRVSSLLFFVLYCASVVRFVRALLGRLEAVVDPLQVEATAWLAGALICVHPLTNESVLLASSRSSVLMSIFALLALTEFVAAQRNATRTLKILGFTVLALLCKETAVVLALLIPLLGWWLPGKERLSRRLVDVAPVILLVAIYAGGYLLVRPLFPSEMGPAALGGAGGGSAPPLITRPGQGLLALWGLARLFFLPYGLSVVHEVAVPSGAGVWLGWLGWPVALAPAALLTTRSGTTRFAGMGLLWFMVALAPIVIKGMNTPMAHHRTLLALVIPTAVVASVIATSLPRNTRWPVAISLLGALSFLSIQHSHHWRSPLALWEYEAKLDPMNVRAWNFLVTAREDNGDALGALEAATRLVALEPGIAIFWWKAASLELESGNLVGAGSYAQRGLMVEPDFVPLLLVQCEQLARTGRAALAVAPCERAVALAPENSAAYNALGNVLFMMDDPRAVTAYQAAVSLDPDNAEAVTNLSRARVRWPEEGR